MPHKVTCDRGCHSVAGGGLGAIHMHHCHLKAASPPVRQREGQVHERIKLDGVVLTVLHGADEGGLVQALQSQRCQLCRLSAALPTADDGTPNQKMKIATNMKVVLFLLDFIFRGIGSGASHAVATC